MKEVKVTDITGFELRLSDVCQKVANQLGLTSFYHGTSAANFRIYLRVGWFREIFYYYFAPIRDWHGVIDLYNKKDLEIARKFAAVLEKEGFEVEIRKHWK